MAAGTGGRERGSRDRSNETCFHRRGRRSWFRTHFVMAVYKCDSMEHEAWAVSLLHFFTVPLISFSYSSEKSCLWFPLLLFLFFSIFSDSLQQLHAPFQLTSAGPNTGRLQPPRKYQTIRAKLLTACFPCPSLSLPLLPLLFPFCPLSLSPPLPTSGHLTGWFLGHCGHCSGTEYENEFIVHYKMLWPYHVNSLECDDYCMATRLFTSGHGLLPGDP